jgi:hypothetical protein
MATLAELLEIIKKWKLDIDTDGKKGPQLRKEIVASGYTITGKTASKTKPKKPITKVEAKKVKVVLKKAKGRGSKVIRGKKVDTVAPAPAPAPPSIKLPPKIPVKPPVIKLPPKAPVKKPPVIKLPPKAPVKKPPVIKVPVKLPPVIKLPTKKITLKKK